MRPLFRCIEDIARAYKVMPVSDESAPTHWRNFMNRVVNLQMEQQVHHKVTISSDPEPYPDGITMLRAIKDTYEFKVSSANCEHPVWDPIENMKFRAVHDILGHGRAHQRWGAAAGFDWYGELEACAAHAEIIPMHHRFVLFVECIAQTGAAIHYNQFQPQKVSSTIVHYFSKEDTIDAYYNFIDNPLTALVR